MKRLMHVRAFRFFDWRFVLTPLTIITVKVEDEIRVIRWGELYVFGIRLARWKVPS